MCLVGGVSLKSLGFLVSLPIALSSMEVSVFKDGKFSVYFRTPLAEGLGVVVLAPDGKLSGGYTVMSYTGHWRTDSEHFEVTLYTKRHSPG
jgi:hypothetical protein